VITAVDAMPGAFADSMAARREGKFSATLHFADCYLLKAIRTDA